MIERCQGMLRDEITDADFVVTLGGAPAHRLLSAGLPPEQCYWLRVWAMRGLLWAGPGDEASLLRAALDDESWRVREMTCKVVARHRVGDLLDDVARLESDGVLRVRNAARRAVRRIMEAET